jgi:MFS family permease
MLSAISWARCSQRGRRERLGARRAFAFCLIATGAALFASALTRDFSVLLALRVAAGITGAVVFVAGGGLAASAGLAGGGARAALLLAVYFAGPGLGILLSGPIVEAVMGPAPADWPAGWIALSCGALLAAVLAAPALRRVPAHRATERAGGRFRMRPLVPIFITYTLFGAGYIAYMTFIVAFLRTQGLGEAQIAVFWAILGASAIPAAFVWGPVLARLNAGRGVFAVMATVLAGAVLPLAAPGPAAAFGSAVLFGGSFLAVVTAVTHVSRQATPAVRLDAGDRRTHRRLRLGPVPRPAAGRRPLRRPPAACKRACSSQPSCSPPCASASRRGEAGPLQRPIAEGVLVFRQRPCIPAMEKRASLWARCSSTRLPYFHPDNMNRREGTWAASAVRIPSASFSERQQTYAGRRPLRFSRICDWRQNSS